VPYQAPVSCIQDQDMVLGLGSLFGYRPLLAPPLFGSLSALVGSAADRSDDIRMKAANPWHETGYGDFWGSAQS
jgi:hypothetical protein